MARNRAARGRERVIHTTRWESVSANFSALSAGSSAIGAILGAGRPPETILRTRGSGLVYVDGAGGSSVRTLISMGLILVPEGQSTTIIWDPFNDGNAPWFWYREFILGYEERVADVVDVPVASGVRFDIDSKAMRKANDDEEVQLVVVNTTLEGALAVNISLAFRFFLGH